jgi:Fur family ferric uptake transcriptional regulator
MERDTRQRAAIRDALAAASRPLLPAEVLQAAQAAVPGLGIATVYRTLKALVEEGELQPVRLPGENPRFERVGHQHHHHFQCRQCQRVFDVHACPGDLGRLAPQGFRVEDHELTLYGRCRDCLATVPGPAAAADRRPQAAAGRAARRRS